MNEYINLISAVSSVIAAISAIISIFLICKYQRINNIQEKTNDIQEFIRLSWSILNNLNLGSMNKDISEKYLVLIDGEIRILLTIGLNITHSKIYSNAIHVLVEDIYKLFKSCWEKECNADEIVKRIVMLQDIYDNNLLSK